MIKKIELLTFDMDKLEKIRQFCWKEGIKFCKIAKFESGLWKTNEDMQSRDILQTSAWWRA